MRAPMRAPTLVRLEFEGHDAIHFAFLQISLINASQLCFVFYLALFFIFSLDRRRQIFFLLASPLLLQALNAKEHRFLAFAMVLLRCISAFVALLLMLPSVLATCYYPNGTESPDDDISCPNSKACCPKDAFCLSNGLCWSSLNFLLRASCTDQSWTSPDCARYCLDGRLWPQTTHSDPG